MAAGQAPEAWINRVVRVGMRSGGGKPASGVLAEVNDRGIVLGSRPSRPWTTRTP